MSFDEMPMNQPEAELGSAPRAAVPGGPTESVPAERGGAAHISIDELPLGASAVLGAPDGLDPTILRLLEMGLTPGTPLAITRRAPGGDPVEVRVRGTRLCVRRADLARFAVASVVPANAKGPKGT